MSFKTITNQAMIAVLVILALVAIPASTATLSAQGRNTNQTPPNPVQTLTQTTLSADVGSTTSPGTSIITVTSATSFTAGNRVVIITAGAVEAMDIVSVSGTSITVNRAAAGTTRHYHASGDVVFTQRQALFSVTGPPTNGCASATTGTGATAVVTSTTTPTPWVDLAGGNVYYCAGIQWFQTVRNGFSTGAEGSAHPLTYTALGALFPVPGLHIINGTTLAMTIAPPTKDMDGMIMYIISQTASAQTVTYTAGFSQSTTSSDVATFGGAVNDGFAIVARAGVWQVLYTRNVTIA